MSRVYLAEYVMIVTVREGLRAHPHEDRRDSRPILDRWVVAKTLFLAGRNNCFSLR